MDIPPKLRTDHLPLHIWNEKWDGWSLLRGSMDLEVITDNSLV